MTWSYNNTLQTPKDQVRYLIQDNVPGRELVQDEEIAWLLQTEANVYMAAAMALDTAISVGGSRGRSSRTAGDVTVAWFSPAEQATMSNWLRQRGSSHQTPSAGGIFRSDKAVLVSNEDWIQLPVVLGSMDNPYGRTAKPLVDPVNPLAPGTF